MPESSNAPMIEAAGLSKFYGDFAAIRDVSFSIQQGQVAAFLGPNGAGKSTTMKILTGYLAPSSGSARIAGLDVATHRIAAAGRLGYLPERPALPRHDPAGSAQILRTRRQPDPSRVPFVELTVPPETMYIPCRYTCRIIPSFPSGGTASLCGSP